MIFSGEIFSGESSSTLSKLTTTIITLIGLGLGIPIILLAIFLVQRRRMGTISSVLGRLRWSWLMLCSLMAVALLFLQLFLAAVLEDLLGDSTLADEVATASNDWVGWERFIPLALLMLLLVPFQAASEEYFFRGWLMQGIGTYVRSAWWGIIITAVLFSLAHFPESLSGFLTGAWFGLVAAWLTVRTGGLEAAIALHVVNNLVIFLLEAAQGDLDRGDVSNNVASAGWEILLLEIPLYVLYALVI
ncbi:MAG: CPBP family intramembrane metalloprotease, partial [Longispora sp.]|nr:CPBP family intramembrane metalloprotease [Longispora sp. (in: high G+C Gram-positive bacteria)]